MAKTSHDVENNTKQLTRLLIVLRMVPRRGRISTADILSRLKSEYDIEIDLSLIHI